MDVFASKLALLNLRVYCDMSCSATDKLQDKLCLNRTTGEMLQIFKTNKEAVGWSGVTALEHAANLATIEALPGQWVEIPKYDPSADRDEFIRRFLSENGIDVE